MDDHSRSRSPADSLWASALRRRARLAAASPADASTYSTETAATCCAARHASSAVAEPGSSSTSFRSADVSKYARTSVPLFARQLGGRALRQAVPGPWQPPVLRPERDDPALLDQARQVLVGPA